MSSDTVIRVENLSKKYILGGGTGAWPGDGLRHALQKWLTSPVRSIKPSGASAVTGEFHALRDVSFDVRRGEVLGIIGRNGAGKSTLLKILSRITEPSGGRIGIKGRVASLLEVGTGFHPELTGRENIFLNGAILGMSRAEVRGKFDEIVTFAETAQFLDTPVKKYSSGMYVRLAFAVAAHLQPDILVIDEVLAVGDVQFQKKCLGKIQTTADEGRTVIFVSHNMGAVAQLCSRGILLESGTIKAIGTSAEVVRLNLESQNLSNQLETRAFAGPLGKKIIFSSIHVSNVNSGESRLLSPSAPIEILVKGVSKADIPAFRVTMALFHEGVRLLTTHDVAMPEKMKAGLFESRFEVPAHFLRPGEYSVAIGGHRDGMVDWLWAPDVLTFALMEQWAEGYEPTNIGLVNLGSHGERRFC